MNPLAALAGNLLMELMRDVLPQPGQVIDHADCPELSEVPMVQRMCQKPGSATVIIGGREWGKTYAGYRLCEIFDRDTYAISPSQKPPSGAIRKNLEEVAAKDERGYWKIPPFSTLFLDDILTYLSVKDYWSDEVQAIEKIIPVCRHERALHLLFAAQVAGQADKWVLQSDLILIKPPDNELFVDIERPGVRRLHEEAMPLWEGKSEQWIQRHIFVVSRLYKGLAWVQAPSIFHWPPQEWRVVDPGPQGAGVVQNEDIIEGEVISDREDAQ